MDRFTQSNYKTSNTSKTSLAIFCGLFTLMTIAGAIANILVLLAVLGKRKMRENVMNLLLANLAIADLLFLMSATTIWVPVVVPIAGECYLPGSPVICDGLKYLTDVFVFMSILTYVIICVER